MDNETRRGQPNVASLAGRNDDAEVRQVRLLGRQDAATKAQVLVGLVVRWCASRSRRRVAPCRFGSLGAPPSPIQWCHSSLSKKS